MVFETNHLNDSGETTKQEVVWCTLLHFADAWLLVAVQLNWWCMPRGRVSHMTAHVGISLRTFAAR